MEQSGIEFHALFADLNHLNYFVSAQTLRPAGHKPSIVLRQLEETTPIG